MRADTERAHPMDIPGNLSARALALIAVGAVAATMLLTACGGSSATAQGTGSCPATAGVTPKQISYGLLYTASGTSAESFAPYRAGVDARLGVANAKGGVYGRTVSYDWADDTGRVQPNLSAAKQLVTTDKTFAIQEFTTSPQGSAAWLNGVGVPVVGTSNNATWTQYSNMFSSFNLITSKTGSITTWGTYARSQGVKKAAILLSNLADGSLPVGNELSTSLRAAGISTTMINAEPTILDVPTIVNEIKNSGADFITGIVDPTEFIQIAVAARASMPNLKILSLIGYDPGIFAVGKQLAGMSISVSYVPFEHPVPAHQVFLNAMAQYAPQQQPAANEVALIGWADADLMLRGLQAAGRCPTRQSFITNLRAVPSYDAGGLLASPVNMRTIFGHLSTCYSMVQISPDGRRFVPVGSGPTCGQPIP
ncbi:MAG: ABC transporter substrate-binding protein [Frankia sp.]